MLLQTFWGCLVSGLLWALSSTSPTDTAVLKVLVSLGASPCRFSGVWMWPFILLPITLPRAPHKPPAPCSGTHHCSRQPPPRIQTTPPFSSVLRGRREQPVPLAAPRQARTSRASPILPFPSRVEWGLEGSQEPVGFLRPALQKASKGAVKFPTLRVWLSLG